MHIRPAAERDRPQIEWITRAQKHFTPEDVTWAIRLALRSSDANDGEYQTVVAEENGSGGVAGFASFGRVLRTSGTFELYWIAVDPPRQRRGIGSALLRFVEQECGRQHGRLLVLETSLRPGFQSAVAFYRRNGFEEESRVKDFYRVEEDKIVFSRTVS